MSIRDISNFRRVSEQLIIGGQPNEEQVKSAAAEGIRTVINLATFNPKTSLPDEEGLVRSLGMNYFFIPVDGANPKESEFDSFEKILQQVSGEKTLVHCYINLRVSAFYSLYAMKHLGWSEAQADEFRAPIWEGHNYPAWEELIAAMKKKIKR